eukprot:GHVL01033563.1.p1 GENE.GHVL01033563.1~~GHVL01033563.1.p1  ORF type:complete len:381 (+),score=60.31 GHVL01033563.1:90-1232(+)
MTQAMLERLKSLLTDKLSLLASISDAKGQLMSQQECDSLQNQINTLQCEKDELIDVSRNIQEEILSHDSSTHQNVLRAAELAAQVQAIQNETRAIQKQRERLEIENKNTLIQLKQGESTVNSLERMILDLLDNLRKHEDDIKNLERQTIENKKKDLESRAVIQQNEEKINRLSTELETKISLTESLRSQINISQKDFIDLRTNITNQESTICTKNKLINESTKELSTLLGLIDPIGSPKHIDVSSSTPLQRSSRADLLRTIDPPSADELAPTSSSESETQTRPSFNKSKYVPRLSARSHPIRRRKNAVERIRKSVAADSPRLLENDDRTTNSLRLPRRLTDTSKRINGTRSIGRMSHTSKVTSATGQESDVDDLFLDDPF